MNGVEVSRMCDFSVLSHDDVFYSFGILLPLGISLGLMFDERSDDVISC